MRNELLERFAHEKVRPLVYKEGLALIREAERIGIPVWIISATFAYIVRPIAEMMGVKNAIGVDLEVEEDGRLLPEIRGVPSFREGKAARMKDALESLGLLPEEMRFCTDSSNDLPLACCFAGEAEAADPDPALLAEAQKRGWPVHEWHAVG